MKRNMILLLFLFLQSVLLVSCSMSGNAIEGRVVEEESRKPIEGVIVVVKWEGYISAFVDSQRSCVHVQTTTTDKNGYYKFPDWKKPDKRGPVQKIKPDITVYKTGYQWPDKTLAKANEYYLTPAKGTSTERLKFFKRIVRSLGCGAAGRSGKNKYNLYKTLYNDAKPLIKTEEDKKTLAWLRRAAARSWTATDELITSGEQKELINEHFKEHLK